MIRLFDFQTDAVDQMVEAVDEWRAMRVKTAIVLRDGRDPIPFIGSFEAIMGSGKTPLMVATLARLGPAIVIWTSKSAPVVDQARDNLCGTGKYGHLLPADTSVMQGLPSRSEWRKLLDATDGLTIWVMTTADRLRTRHTMDPSGPDLPRRGCARPFPAARLSPTATLAGLLGRPR